VCIALAAILGRGTYRGEASRVGDGSCREESDARRAAFSAVDVVEQLPAVTTQRMSTAAVHAQRHRQRRREQHAQAHVHARFSQVGDGT
jgi:hypothetical protein